MSNPSIPEFSRPVEVENLAQNRPRPFDISPDARELADLAALMDALSLTKMRFAGQIAPEGKHGWRVSGHLGATVTQNCVVTMDPVRTRIETDVALRFLPPTQMPAPGDEDDLHDDIEPLDRVIDLGLIATEALALAIPPYPRKPGVALPPEARDDDPETVDPARRPFAALAGLRDKLRGDD